MPPIAPPDKPESASSSELTDDAAGAGCVVAVEAVGSEELADGSAVVDVMTCSADKLMG
jgi:hypothetical protein